MTQLDLEAIEARCETLSERLGESAWTLEGPNHYGLFNVYDGDGNIVTCNGVEEQQDFIAHSRADIPALLAEVERLRRDIHDERVRRDEWKKMYNLAGTEVERLRASLEAVLEEAESDLDRDVIVTECRSALG